MSEYIDNLSAESWTALTGLAFAADGKVVRFPASAEGQKDGEWAATKPCRRRPGSIFPRSQATRQSPVCSSQ